MGVAAGRCNAASAQARASPTGRHVGPPQVVELGQQNQKLKDALDDQGGAKDVDRVKQLQECNKQVVQANSLLKGKLGQLLSLLRMYHHKVGEGEGGGRRQAAELCLWRAPRRAAGRQQRAPPRAAAQASAFCGAAGAGDGGGAAGRAAAHAGRWDGAAAAATAAAGPGRRF
jgi:hypothetical protein